MTKAAVTSTSIHTLPMLLTAPEAHQFDTLGYFIKRAAFTSEEIAMWSEALKSHEGKKEGELPTGAFSTYFYPAGNDYRIMNFLECDESFLTLIDHSEILRVVDSVVRYPARLILPSSISRRKGPGCPLHSDRISHPRIKHGKIRTDFLTCIVALTDCGPDDGPLVVIEGSHKSAFGFPFNRIHPEWEVGGDTQKELMRAAKVASDEIRIRWEDIPGYKELHVKAGDVIFFFESLIHGAKAIRSDRTRRTLNLMYAPYWMGNINGIAYTEDLLLKANRRQLELLMGPFSGFRFECLDMSKYPPPYLFRLMPNRTDFVWKTDEEYLGS
jgi:ectoine hydroxylase-related dioxygenase (phytanoyl-CoA dioxygenase family)